jgi:hypothetical protein
VALVLVVALVVMAVPGVSVVLYRLVVSVVLGRLGVSAFHRKFLRWG